MNQFFLLTSIALSSLLISQPSVTEVNLRSKNFNINKSALAIQGYDPVNYYLGAAKMGLSEYSYKYNGITYRFASLKNMDLFKLSPSKFEPVYGGWCAYAMGATGEKVGVNPETYKIIDGKLYLFYNALFTNTLPKWNKDGKSLKNKANENWIIINE